ELFTGLQQGTVDGQENPLATIYSDNFYEVQDYLSLSGHIYSTAPLTLSEQTKEKLSDEQEEILLSVAEELKEDQREYLDDKEEELQQELEEEGMEVNEVDRESFREKVEP